MKLTEFREDDGFFESIVSFEEGTSPILKLRVVKKLDGNYNIVLRDFKTGHMIGGRNIDESLEKAKILAERYLYDFLESCAKKRIY